MELKYKGANCVAITNNKNLLLTDANVKDNGLSVQTKGASVVLATQPQFAVNDGSFELTSAGEYEVATYAINGISVRAHTDEEGQKTATMYKIMTSDATILITGHIHPDLSDEQLEAIGMVDIVVIPVGGNGYTLDAIGAVQVIKKIEPKIVIPTHFKESGVKYPVEQNEIEPFVKELGAAHETDEKLKLKSGILSENMQVVQLKRS